ncbi:MAG: class I SAM-dependent methyltransferase [bacterium]|nr:class I SAM-dependent methyltransferase [bacterium]
MQMPIDQNVKSTNEKGRNITNHLHSLETKKSISWIKRNLSRNLLFKQFKKIKNGYLVINTKNNSHSFGDKDAYLHASMEVHDESIFYDMLIGGELFLGLGYVNKKWHSESPHDVLLVIMLNCEIFKPVLNKSLRLVPYGRKVRQYLYNRIENTITNNKDLVGLTYNIGNDFHEWMLGPSMQYSCAIWPHPEATYLEAQDYKMELVAKKLKVEKSHTVLEVGCGWGQLADHIHKTYGAEVKGIALAREQVAFAQENFPGCTFEYADYREVEGEYDRVISVGMVTHVGRRFINEYIQTLTDRLKPGGRLLIHTMMYNDKIFFLEGAQKFPTFPALVMPNADAVTHGDLTGAAMNTGELRVVHSETFGMHYARTGKEWLKNLRSHKKDVLEKYSERQFRAFEYAWSMGSASMETGTTLVHMVFEKQPYGSPLTNTIL